MPYEFYLIGDWLEDNASRIFYGCLVLAVSVAISIFLYGKLATYDQTVKVTGLTWQRVQSVEVFKTVHMDTSESDMPPDAYNVDRYTTSICTSHTIGNIVIPSCTYYHNARYDVDRWVWDHNLITTGTSHDEMVWPSYTPDYPDGKTWLGMSRAGNRRQLLYVHFVTPENKPYDDLVGDIQSWRSFDVGQTYAIKMNRFDEPLWDTLKAK